MLTELLLRLHPRIKREIPLDYEMCFGEVNQRGLVRMAFFELFSLSVHSYS